MRFIHDRHCTWGPSFQASGCFQCKVVVSRDVRFDKLDVHEPIQESSDGSVDDNGGALTSSYISKDESYDDNP